MHQHVDPVGGRDAADARAHELGGVVGRQLAGQEAGAGAAGLGDAVEAEAAPVVAVQVVGHEVPAAAERDEPVRLGEAGGPVARVGGVAELDALVVAAGLRERGEDVGVERRGGVPRGRRGDRTQGLHPAAQPRRHHLDHLRERPHPCLLDAGHRALRHHLHADGQRDGLVVVDHERGQRGPRGELVAALRAAVGVHRVAELAEAVDVAAQRARGDLEPVGQLRAGPEAVGLQQRQQAQRPRARVGHISSVAAMRSESDRWAH